MSRFARSALLTQSTRVPASEGSDYPPPVPKGVSDPHGALPRRGPVTVRNTTEVQLSGRGIKTLANFERFENLESLWLNDNAIADIKHLDHCFSLKTLRLHNNNISTLKGCLRKTKFLKTLSLANNKIRDLASTISYITHLHYLEELDLSGNPLCEELNYRLHMIKAMPSLHVLDNHEIKLSELKAARELPSLQPSGTGGHGAKHAKPPPHLPFQRSAPRGRPFESKMPPTFDALARESHELKRRDRWFGAANGGDTETIQSLIDSGKIDINRLHPRSQLAALHMATLAGASPAVRLLLELKADPNLPSPNGNTALHQAAEGNRLEVVRLLVEAKADLVRKNGRGETARDVARQCKHREIEHALAKAENVILYDPDDPKMHVFKPKVEKFWHENFIVRQLGERFRDFAEDDNTMAREDVEALVTSIMLRVKPDAKSVESLVKRLAPTDEEKRVGLQDITNALKESKWVPVDKATRDQYSKELKEDAMRLSQKGLKNEKALKRALELSTFAAFLEAD